MAPRGPGPEPARLCNADASTHFRAGETEACTGREFQALPGLPEKTATGCRFLWTRVGITDPAPAIEEDTPGVQEAPRLY